MKLIQNKLYLTMPEMVECGFVEARLREAKSRGTKCWHFIDDPDDRRRVLVGFEDLTEARKEMVEKRFGNPYDHVARKPILCLVDNTTCFKENEYFLKYRYVSITGEGAETPAGSGKALPIDRVNKYTRAAKWLKMIGRVLADKRIIKKELRLTVKDFFTHVTELVNLEKERGKTEGYTGLDVLPGDFPGTYQRLLNRVERYQQEGADGLIDARFGNKHAAKLGKINVGENAVMRQCGNVPFGKLMVTGEKKSAFAVSRYNDQLAVIRTISRMHNNFDAAQVSKMANLVFERNGWQTVSDATIRNFIADNQHVLSPGRRGKRAYMSEIAMQVKRKAPELPLQYWTMDGWTVELLYRDTSSPALSRGEGAAKRIEYKRMVAVVVLDACCKYPVGYAIGERENSDLIRAANRNALKHVQELLGKAYRPWQVQSDNYSLKNLTPFYQAMSHLHTPAAVGNAKSKIVEPYFKDLNKNYCQYMPNWSGFNINASKKNQVNTEMLDKIKNAFPDKAGVVRQIESIVRREREAKLDAYTKACHKLLGTNNAPEVMTDMDYLMVMGQPLGSRTNRITGQGIIKHVNGEEYTFDSFDPEFRANMHLDWLLVGDVQDLTKVLAISPDGKLRFVLEQKRVLPMDVRSTSYEDREYRSRIDQFNKQRIAQITDTYAHDSAVVAEIINNTPLQLDRQDELQLKVMLTQGGQQKERVQDAKRLGVVNVQMRKCENVQDNWTIPKCANVQMSGANTNDNWEAMQLRFMESKIDFKQFADNG